MAQVLEQGDIFGRIGKQVGEGIGEQIPRNMLSSQLAKVQGLPPQVAQAALIPGGLQALQPYLPYLQSQAAAQANLPPGQGIAQQPAVLPKEEIIPGTQNIAKPSIKPVERLTNDPEIQRQIAAQEFQKNPAKFNNNFENALQYQQQRFATQEKQIADVGTKFGSLLPTLLHKEGKTTTSEVLGELQNNFVKRAEDAVISGKMTADQAAREYSTKALNFAKARDRFQAPGRDFWRSLVSSTPLGEIRAAKKAYEEAGAPEAFLNDLIANRKLSLPYASALAFPPSQELQKTINGIKKANTVEKIDSDIFRKVLEKATPNDSLQAIALQLQKKGYSPLGFLNLAQENMDRLVPFQQRELENKGNFQPSLSDILYFTMSGEKP